MKSRRECKSRWIGAAVLCLIVGVLWQSPAGHARAASLQGTESSYYNLHTTTIAGNTIQVFNIEKKAKKEELNRKYPEEIYTAYFFESLDFTKLLPEGATAGLPAIDVTSMLFLSGPHDFDITITENDIPPEIRQKIADHWGESWVDIPIKNTITFKGCLDTTKNTELRTALESLGIKFSPYVITGTLGVDPVALLKKRKDYLKDEFLKGLSLQIALAPPVIPGVKRIFGLKSLTLGLSSGIYDLPPWNTLPASIVEGRKKAEINLFLSGGGWLKTWKGTKDTDVLIDLTHRPENTTFTILNIAREKFDFGRDFLIPLDFEDSAGYRLQLTRTQSGGKEFKMEMTGFGEVRFGDKAVDVIVDVDLDSDKEKPTLKYVEFDDQILLSDIVGDRLQNKASRSLLELGLTKLRVQPDGLEARATLFGQPADVFIFETGDGTEKGVNIAFGLEKGLTLDKLSLAPGGGASSLKDVTLPSTLFFYSEKGIRTKRKAIENDILRHLYDRIYSTGDNTLVLNGAGFITKFDKSTFGKIGRAAHKLGAQDEAMILADMAGVFDSRPFALNLYLTADLKKSAIQALAGKAFSSPKDTIPRIHIGLMKDEVAVGLGVDFNLGSKGGLPGSLAGEVQVDIDNDGLGLNFVGDLEEWKHPFDMPTITLKDVRFEFGVDDEATLKPGFGSTVNYLGKDVQVDGSLRLEIGDGGFPLPTGVAFKGAIDSLDSETWVYVDDIIVLIIVVAVLALVTGGAAFLLIGLFTGGTAWIVAGAIGAAAGVGALGLFTNVVGPAITVAVIGDIVVENAKHPEKLKTTLQDVKKFDVGDGVKQLVDAVVIPVKKDFNKAEATFAALEAKIITMKDAYLSFATPGAEDAGNNIPEGLYVHGEAYLFNTIHLGNQSHEVYKDSASKDSQKSVSAAGEPGRNMPVTAQQAKSTTGSHVSTFQLGPLHFEGNTLYTRPDPLGITSTVELFGVREEVTIRFDDGLYFDAAVTLGDLGDIETVFKYDDSAKDFFVLADLSSTIGPSLEQEVRKGIDEIISSAHLSSQQVSSDLKKAGDEVQKAQDAVTAAMRKVTEEIEKDPTVRTLESQVNRAIDYAEHGVYNDIDSLCKKSCCHSTFHHHWCVGEKSCKSGLDWMAKKAGSTVNDLKSKLKTAKSSVQIPKALNAAVEQAREKLKSATATLNQIQSLSDNISGAAVFLHKIDAEVDKELEGSFIAVDEAILAGSLADLHKGLPLVLEVKYTLHGKQRQDYFGFIPGNSSYNAKALALLPITVLDTYVGSIQDPSTRYLTHWLMALGNAQLSHIINDVEKELMAEEKQYQKIIDTFIESQKKLALYHTNFKVDLSKTTSTYSETDLMPPSRQYTNRYLAVGHSALCLGVASNGVDVYQENCKDIESERWSTQDLGNGYVQLRSKGLCLKARTKENTETEPLILSRCDGNDEHEQWKVLSSDGLFDRIVNRYSEKCLHFDSENANPKTAYATWSSCLGMDSQTFREIADAERPTYHKVQERVKAANHACLSAKAEFMGYFQKSGKGHATATKNAYEEMKHRQHDVLVADSCAPNQGNTFNFVEMVNGEVKLVHDQSGWCVGPRSTGGSLVLLPCNKNRNLFWKSRGRGDGFALENSYQQNSCISLGPIPEHKKTGPAVTAQCRKDEAQDIGFSK